MMRRFSKTGMGYTLPDEGEICGISGEPLFPLVRASVRL